MAASRIMDAIELSPGCAGGQSDAPQAYCQAEFGFGMDVRPTEPTRFGRLGKGLVRQQQRQQLRTRDASSST